MPPTPPTDTPRPKIIRGVPPEKQDPVIKYKDIGKEGSGQSDWGTGEQGYKQPNTPVEKMRLVLRLTSMYVPLIILVCDRKNLPYKVCPESPTQLQVQPLTRRIMCSTSSGGIGEISNWIFVKLFTAFICIYIPLPMTTKVDRTYVYPEKIRPFSPAIKHVVQNSLLNRLPIDVPATCIHALVRRDTDVREKWNKVPNRLDLTE